MHLAGNVQGSQRNGQSLRARPRSEKTGTGTGVGKTADHFLRFHVQELFPGIWCDLRGDGLENKNLCNVMVENVLERGTKRHVTHLISLVGSIALPGDSIEKVSALGFQRGSQSKRNVAKLCKTFLELPGLGQLKHQMKHCSS